MSKRLPTEIRVYGRKPIAIAEMTDERLVATVRMLRASGDLTGVDPNTSPVYRALMKEVAKRELGQAVRRESGWISEGEGAHV